MTKKSEPNGMPEGDHEQPFMSHLVELRDRLLRVVLAILVCFVGLFPFANDLYVFLADPLMRHLPAGTSMIATEVASPFLTPFKLSLVLAIFVALPYLFYQLWAFVAPGLYQHERRLVLPLVISSTFLFYLGMAFAYYVVFPLVFAFFTGTAPEGVAVMTDIARYLDFVLKLFFAFGVAFEVPVATMLAVWTGMTTPERLAQKRPYIIIGAFVVGMLLTPPDVISQTLLALPMWVLFELGVIFSRLLRPDRQAGETDDEDGDGEAGRAPAGVAPGGGAAVSERAGVDGGEPIDLDAELDRIEAEEAAMDRGSAGSPPEPGADPGHTRDGLKEELELLGDQGGEPDAKDSPDKPVS